MARKIALVACVSKKNSIPMPARDLYISDWFRKASAYARRVADEWYIIPMEGLGIGKQLRWLKQQWE